VVPTYINGLSEEEKVMTNLTFSKQVHISVSKCFVFLGGEGGISIFAYVENVETSNTELSTFISVLKKQKSWESFSLN
jgi:hypothetical protein